METSFTNNNTRMINAYTFRDDNPFSYINHILFGAEYLGEEGGG